jgi:hypothetical protein
MVVVPAVLEASIVLLFSNIRRKINDKGKKGGIVTTTYDTYPYIGIFII